jgi:hypothetical protein
VRRRAEYAVEKKPWEDIAMRKPGLLLMTGLAVLAAGLGLGRAAPGGESESQRRQQFVKAYNSPNKDERKSAVQSLAECNERATLEMLIKVVATEKEKDIRLAAYNLLAARPEDDPGASSLLVQCFRAENDVETKHEMVRAMQDRKFKFEVLAELISFLAAKCSYPDIPETVSQYSATGNTPQRYAKQMTARGQFHNVVLTINALTAQSFTSGKKTVEEVRAWWAAHGAEFQKADRDLQKQLRDEAAAKKAGANP